MIQVINNYITSEQAFQMMEGLPFSSLESKIHDRPSELLDAPISLAPVSMVGVMQRLYADHYFKDIPDAVSVHEYLPGQSIKAHIDDVIYGDTVAVISLKGTCKIIFEKQENTLEYILEPLSLVVFAGEHRTEWTHHIPAVDNVRISMVIRKEKY